MGRVPGGRRRSRMAMLMGIVGMVVGYHHRSSSSSRMRVRVDGHSNNRMEVEDGHSRGREMLGTGDREGTGRGGNKFLCFEVQRVCVVDVWSHAVVNVIQCTAVPLCPTPDAAQYQISIALWIRKRKTRINR
jgi:hypothetical protein